jgi:NAD(P)-dependent dehydrogenase (short-subunit alcohol dehydrogenase family)
LPITLIYARTLRADGITVNAFSPGYVATGVFLSENGGTHTW